jgi:hypothetical protein
MIQSFIDKYFHPEEKVGFLKCVSKPFMEKRRQTQLGNYFRQVLPHKL